MKIVVTGGAGQLGTLVLRKLLADPANHEIVALDMRPPVVASKRVKFVLGDVRDPGIELHFRGAEAVIHLAFIVTKVMDPLEFEAINVGGSKNVFERGYAAGVRRFVYASSVAAYGVVDRTGLVTEETARVRDARFAYAACKFDVEAFLDAWEAARPEVIVARMRPSVLMGTRIEHNLGAALRYRVIPALPQPVPMVWDEDAADAFVLALEKKARGAFNLSSDAPLNGAGLSRAGGLRLIPLPTGALEATMALSEFLSQRGLGVDPGWLRAILAELPPYDTRRAREELGWQPSCPSAESVIRCFVERDSGVMDRRLRLFFRMVDFGAQRAGGGLAGLGQTSAEVHLWLTGPGGGDVALRLHGGRLRVTLGVPRPPSSVVFLEVARFFDLLAGRLDFAALQESGSLRVEGEPMGALLIGAMVTMFRKQAESASGVRGRVLSAFGAWLSR